MFCVETWINRKRDGKTIPGAEISRLVKGIADGTVTDAQIGAFTMAVRYQGMDQSEQTSLTLAMRDSGSVLHWGGLGGPILGKHSTGGVGDWTSIVLAPMIAACGGYIPMISGRGLGHTGGTLDKLESIPGYRVQFPLDKVQDQVRRTGMAMVGQGPELAPADGRMYAVRDVTATVESIPLIVSSILAKKLAEGLDALVLDVKTGNGAFMSKYHDSQKLAQNLCHTAMQSGTSCHALITDMNQPLGRAAGNVLELQEAIDFLTGVRRHPRMEEVIFGLAAELLTLGGLAESREQAVLQLQSVLDSGAATEKFAQNINEQGGPVDLLENQKKYLLKAPVVRPLEASSSGWISTIDTRALGMIVVHLGGGRTQIEDTIDPRVGFSGLCAIGDRIEEGQPLCMIHADSEQDWKHAAALASDAMGFEEQAPRQPVVVYELITGE